MTSSWYCDTSAWLKVDGVEKLIWGAGGRDIITTYVHDIVQSGRQCLTSICHIPNSVMSIALKYFILDLQFVTGYAHMHTCTHHTFTRSWPTFSIEKLFMKFSFCSVPEHRTWVKMPPLWPICSNGSNDVHEFRLRWKRWEGLLQWLHIYWTKAWCSGRPGARSVLQCITYLTCNIRFTTQCIIC